MYNLSLPGAEDLPSPGEPAPKASVSMPAILIDGHSNFVSITHLLNPSCPTPGVVTWFGWYMPSIPAFAEYCFCFDCSFPNKETEEDSCIWDNPAANIVFQTSDPFLFHIGTVSFLLKNSVSICALPKIVSKSKFNVSPSTIPDCASFGTKDILATEVP